MLWRCVRPVMRPALHRLRSFFAAPMLAELTLLRRELRDRPARGEAGGSERHEFFAAQLAAEVSAMRHELREMAARPVPGLEPATAQALERALLTLALEDQGRR
jgi:hypothetical protein